MGVFYPSCSLCIAVPMTNPNNLAVVGIPAVYE